MMRRPPRSTLDRSSAASDVYKRQYNPPPAASPNNPIFVGDAVRWPSVYLNETENIYYMVHTVNYGGPSYLVYRTSFDGLIWSSPTTIIQDGFNLSLIHISEPTRPY